MLGIALFGNPQTQRQAILAQTLIALATKSDQCGTLQTDRISLAYDLAFDSDETRRNHHRAGPGRANHKAGPCQQQPKRFFRSVIAGNGFRLATRDSAAIGKDLNASHETKAIDRLIDGL